MSVLIKFVLILMTVVDWTRSKPASIVNEPDGAVELEGRTLIKVEFVDGGDETDPTFVFPGSITQVSKIRSIKGQEQPKSAQSGNDTDIPIVFRLREEIDPIRSITEEEESRCVEDGYSMPYLNQITGQVGCFPLAEQGPCQDGYWFTLDATGTKAVCRPRDCSDPTHVLLMDSCVVLFDDYQCPLGQEVKATPLGYGECDCKEDFLPYRDPVYGEERCYQEYLRGPCPQGQQLVFNASSGDDALFHADQVICREFSCPTPGFLQWKDGRCYNDSDVEECVGEHVTFNPEDLFIECDFGLRTILDAPKSCRQGFRIAPDGKSCREERNSTPYTF